MTTSTSVLDTTTTATGLLREQSIRTTVEANDFDADHGRFTATILNQGRVSATAYNAPNGAGTHFGTAAHGVLSAEVKRSMYGLTITVLTEDGQMLQVDLFGVRDRSADTTAPITVTLV